MATKFGMISTIITMFILINMGIADMMELINFDLKHYLIIALIPSAAMSIWLLIEYIIFRIKGE